MLYSCTHKATVVVKGLTSDLTYYTTMQWEDWLSPPKVNCGLETDPNVRQPGSAMLLMDWIMQCFTSPPTQYRLCGRWGYSWTLLDHFHMGQDSCHACSQKLKLITSELYKCGEPQTMNHTAYWENCRLAELTLLVATPNYKHVDAHRITMACLWGIEEFKTLHPWITNNTAKRLRPSWLHTTFVPSLCEWTSGHSHDSWKLADSIYTITHSRLLVCEMLCCTSGIYNTEFKHQTMT